MIAPSYLGDGVYATDQGYHIMLTTGHHEEHKADNVIFLDDNVCDAIIAYINKKRESNATRLDSTQEP